MVKSVQVDDLALVVSEMLHRIRERESSVVLRADFDDLGSSGLVDDALDSIVSQNELVQIGDGVYGKARLNSLTNSVMLAEGFKTVALEALDRLGVKWEYSEGERLYREGKVLQMPGGTFVIVKDDYRPAIGYSTGGRKFSVSYWNENTKQWD